MSPRAVAQRRSWRVLRPEPKVFPLEFRPSLIPSLAAVVFLALTAAAGFWQLDRAAQKQRMLDRFASSSAAPVQVMDGRGLSAHTGDSLRYRRVRLEGRYLAGRQFLLDNRVHDGVPGYQVVTPFRPEGGDAVVLVDRGWVALGSSRETLPAVPVSGDPRRILARVDRLREQAFVLGDTGYGDGGWPRVVQRLESDSAAGLIGHRVLPMLLLLDPGEADGYTRIPKPYQGLGPERHHGYAVQWFSLSIALVVIYCVLTLRRRRPGREP